MIRFLQSIFARLATLFSIEPVTIKQGAAA
jgi:hypothetical protein